MPSFVLEVFGVRLMPVVYGFILTAWSCSAAVMKDTCKENAGPLTFATGAGLLALGFVFSLFLNNAPFAGEKTGMVSPDYSLWTPGTISRGRSCRIVIMPVHNAGLLSS